MAFFRVKLDYVVETEGDHMPSVDPNDLIIDGLKVLNPQPLQVLPGARLAYTRLTRPPKSRV